MEDVWELKFEHIDWADIADAELSGDHEALQKLMDRSAEIRRSMTMQSPPLPSSDENVLPFENFLEGEEDDEEENEDPPLPPPKRPFSAPRPRKRTAGIRTTPTGNGMNCRSYADALQNSKKGSKRRVADRLGLSPIELPSKRTRDPQSSPTSAPPGGLLTTPILHETLVNMEDDIHTSETPEGDRILYSAAQRRLFTDSVDSSPVSSYSSGGTPEREGKLLDPHRLNQRQKQIDYGKNTAGYERYTQIVPRWKRSKFDPKTPDKMKNCSTRSWQGQIRVWRRALHKWDPPMTASATSFTSEDARLCDMSNENDTW